MKFSRATDQPKVEMRLLTGADYRKGEGKVENVGLSLRGRDVIEWLSGEGDNRISVGYLKGIAKLVS